ncbi:pantoate kinase [Methanolacinia paynteri]|uniref:pantoate kinase n=1 Tax=Methanolacinia paynteri TaxID=230356 RepID=UPI00064EBF87|nr:pantoate kinase [Methanolacinia paynteri]
MERDREAVAFCPGHISGWFKPVFIVSEGLPGSVGGGIVIDRGVESTAVPSDETRVTCLYTGSDGSVLKTVKGSSPVEHALKTAGITAEIVTRSDLPPESGFGLSGAAIISSLAAASRVSGIRLSKEQIFRIAYETEVSLRTGLGDVPAIAGGGYVCRRSPGLKGEIIRRYDMDEPIFVLNFGPLPTAGVLGEENAVKRIEDAYSGNCPGSPAEFFRTAGEFSERSGFITPEVRDVLSACASKKIPAFMTMLGNGVAAYGKNASAVLRDFGTPEEMHMSKTGFTGDGEDKI